MKRRVPIGELGEIVSGATPRTHVTEYWNGDIPWVTPADLSDHEGIFFRGKPKRITKAGLENCSAALVPKGTILFSSRAPIGHCAVAEYPLCTNQGFKNLVPNSKLDSLYGYFALKFVTPEIIQKGRGATFAEVNKEMMEETTLPYCDLPEQKRIAGLLEQADRLRRTRRYALELSDTFLPAAFLQLFGDPLRNEKGWPQESIDELGNVSTGGTPASSKSGMFGGSIPFITPSDLDAEEWKPTRFLTEGGAADVGTVRAGSTMVCCIGATIGKTDFARATSAFNQQINAIEWGGKVDDHFGFYLLRFFSTVVAQRGRSTTLPILKKSAFEEIVVPVPPLAQQHHFAALVAQHERLRANQREALRQAGHLFQSLLHRAFNGESECLLQR